MSGRAPNSRPASAARASLAQLEREAKAAAREQEIRNVASTEAALTGLHRETFPPAVRRFAAEAESPSGAEHARRRRETARAAVKGISWWDLSRRREARTQAFIELDDLIRREAVADVIRAQHEQIDLDQEWARLQAHEAMTVIARVDEAFADNASESTCMDAGRDPANGTPYITCLVLFGAVDLVPEKKPALTPTGKPTLHKRNKTERNDFYARALASTVLATAKEGLAVAVAAEEARVLVVRRNPAASDPSSFLGVIYVGRFGRAVVEGTGDPVAAILSAPQAQMLRKGATREVTNLPLGADPDLRALLAEVAQSLSSA